MAKLPEGLSRFHATWNRVHKTTPIGENVNITLHDALNTTGNDNYVLLDAEGQGTLAGIFLNIDNTIGNWYGEGDDMIFIDGEAMPSLVGTGTEDYFCAAWGYPGGFTPVGYGVAQPQSGCVRRIRPSVDGPAQQAIAVSQPPLV